MYAYEKTYLDLAVEPGEQWKADLAISTFYAIWDYIKEISGDLVHLEGDCRVVDAIYAVNDARRREIPNETTLKAMDDAENDENLFGPFDTVAEMMEALNA